MNLPDDDLLEFASETPLAQANTTTCWKVAIVDDDDDVHRSTELSLADTEILGRPLAFLHARSAAEARALFAAERDIAVILLDVVMETQEAGLLLVDEIRHHFRMQDVRIILRTGQPGYAPELEAIRDYDINDYSNKSELSRTRLYAALTAAIRAYQQIRIVNASRAGLAHIVRGSAELLRSEGLGEFAAGVITQMAGLLGLPPEGLVCARRDAGAPCEVIAAAGRFDHVSRQPLAALHDAGIRAILEHALTQRTNVVEPGQGIALYFGSRPGRDLAAYVETGYPADELDPSLLEVFCANVSVCLDNIELVQRLNEYSYFDPLVHLPNRRQLLELLDAHLNEREGRRGVLAVVDIDHFGEINGAFGYHYGDALLKGVAARIVAGCGPAARVARVGSDSFAVFWSAHDADVSCLDGLFSEPLEVEGDSIIVSVTVGVVRLDDVGGDGSEALEDGYLALKRAKQAERGSVARYNRGVSEEIRGRVNLLHNLRGAFGANELFLVFQPQIDLATGRCVGAEALLRWRTGDGAMIPPDHFIPLAERSGLIVSIGEWVLRRACEEAARMAQAGHASVRMAVNVSVIQFRDPHFLGRLRAAIEDSGVSPRQIELEITESVAMGEGDRMIELFGRVKAMGLDIAIDDFGTGFSSLSQLQRMNVDRLKIDRAFINDIGGAGKGGDIAGLVCGLGDRLGIELIAEGIEQAEQAGRLQAMGCQLGQGYHFARPMPAEDWRAWLAAHSSGSGAQGGC
ncbi:putative bifunctional diguanylate cyclase/phosphodiesterase [Aromatoleum petrolei]|uniref:EAL domain-containing protein n=1 Tax=Aromatoleum petrolei TaxID=76116 RepID=A0ABX1MHK7_9RHOO|nr:EAL domain-containing protein [Aromatoleum petrolei]NMF87422.1 EAL domain-containing protein [Aromatoleum petrolei]QTQ35788.1 Putative diguanylate cyclase/phosphodiesterase [Aromatoleum petrolei]